MKVPPAGPWAVVGGVLTFLGAMLLPHNAGEASGSEWVRQLPEEEEQRWAELDKKRRELAKEGRVLAAQEYEEWLALDQRKFPQGRDNSGTERPRKKTNPGNEKGKRREEEVARLTGGTVAKDSKGQDTLLKDERGRHTGLDVLGPNGEYIQVGGPAKAKDLDKFRRQLEITRKAAERDGVEAHVYLEEGTPQRVIDAAVKQLGKDNVHIFDAQYEL